jgi:O-antigen/teichoic acid export membrane protein
MVSDQINQALQIILVLVVPAAAGLGSLSEVAYGTLFGLENIDITGTILAWYAPVALLFALFTVSAAILQGINQQKFAVVSLTAGLLMKILFNVQLIHMFGAKGAIFGTGLAVGTAVVLNIWKVKVSIDFSFKRTNKIALLTIIFSAMMVIAVLIIKNLLGIYLPYMESRTAAAIVLFAAMGVGGLLYLYLGYKSTLLERVLGKRVNILHRIFRKRSV